MKRERLTAKQRIQKQIELRNAKLVFIDKRGDKKMNERDKLRIFGVGNSQKEKEAVAKHLLLNVDVVGNNSLKDNTVINKYIPYEIKDYGRYLKPEVVDYDTMVYISSYERYEKLRNILNQLYTQKSEYSFKIIVMNDGSIDERYDEIKKEFPEIIYLKNEINGGREFYLKTVNVIFNEIKKYKTLSVIQIDDDFILCENFINIIMNKFLELKEENNAYVGIRYHHHSYREDEIREEDYFDPTKRFQDFDGGSVFDVKFLELFNYELIPTGEKYMWHLWFVLNSLVRKFGVLVHTTRKSLAIHTGNDDSKLNSEARKKRKLYTVNFIDDVSKYDTK